MKAVIHFCFTVIFALCAAGAASLPAGYTQVEFVNATGTQWVDTEYMPASTDDVDIEIEASLNQKSGYKTLFSMNTVTSGTQKRYQLQTANGSYSFRFDHNREQLNGALVVRYGEVNTVVHVVGKKCYTNDVLSVEATSDAFTPNHNLVLFAAIAKDGTYGSFHYGNCYGVKIYTRVGGVRTLYADLVPALETATSTAGFYDVVRNKFYHSGSVTELNAPRVRRPTFAKDTKSVLLDIGNKLAWDSDAGDEFAARDYCILTNSIPCGTASAHTMDNPKCLPNAGGILQVGELDGEAGELPVSYYYHYVRGFDMILAKGFVYSSAQSYAYFNGGRARVLTTAEAPFDLGSSTAGNNQFGIAFGNGHQFVGTESAALCYRVSGHVTSEQCPTWKNDWKSLCLWSGSPKYLGKWVFTSNAHVDVRDPVALGGARETFADDAIWFYNSGNSYADRALGDGYCKELRLNFSGTMPSKGRGIKVQSSYPVAFVVPTGHVVHCDMPVKVTSTGRKVYIHSHYWTGEVSYVTSKLSLGACEGGRFDITNRVAVRFASIGQTTATILNTLDSTPSFWAEVDATNGCHYTTIGPKTTFTPYDGKIPIRVDFAAAQTQPGELCVPVMKIDTAATVVTKDDFELIQDADFIAKTSRKDNLRLVVDTVGTTQTVNLVGVPRGLMLIVK